jgi:short-subunit dehydrogenase
MTANFSGQMALITGVAAGIGRQFALEFARRGAAIAGIDLQEEPLQQLVRDIRLAGITSKVEVAVADVSHRPALQSAIQSLTQAMGPPDFVIANAGVGSENPINGFRADVFEKQIAVNLVGVANTLEPVLPAMIARRRGHIIALSSLASYRGLPLMAGYCASKAGVSAFMDSLRVELRAFQIHCTTICPGFIGTQMTKDLAVPTPGGILSVEVAVARMMRAIERKRPYVAFPYGNHFLLALNRILPTWLGDALTMMKMGAALKNQSPSAPVRGV